MAAAVRRFLPQKAELRKALWLGAVLSAITCSYTLVKVARDALFLSRLPAQQLPLVYVMVGVLTLGASWVFARLTVRVSPLRSLTGSALVSALVLIAFALGFQGPHGWLPMAFYVWVNLYGLILTSQFWAFTNTRSDPSEAKRIFGIIGGGGILGGLVGGVVAAHWSHQISLQAMALAGAVLLLIMVIAMTVAVRQGGVPATGDTTADPGEPPVRITRVSYVRWLAIATLCSVIVTGLVDYEFKVVAQTRYGNAADLASFFGRMFVGVNVAAILIQLFATRWFLQRFGAASAAAILPAGLAITATTTLLSPKFRFIIAARLWDQTMRFSLHKSGSEMFYFPLDIGLRRRAKALIEAGIERFGDGLAGLILFAAGSFLVVGPVELSAIILVMVVVWLVAWAQVRGGYVRELGRSLRRMNADADREPVSLRERHVVKELLHALDSPHELVVLQAMSLLADTAPRLLESRLPRLLEHRSPAVRARALERADRLPADVLRASIERLVHDPDPRVRVQALRLDCSLGDGDGVSTEKVRGYLEAKEPEVRASALACLVEHGPLDASAGLREQIDSWVRSPAPEPRIAAAEALGTRRATYDLLERIAPLLDDPDLAVRRAALTAVGRARWADRLPDLIRALGARETENAACNGLVAFGDDAIAPLAAWLADPGVPIEIRRVIPKVLSEMPRQAAMDALLAAPSGEDVVLDYRVLKAADVIRLAHPELEVDAARVEQNLDRDVRDHLAASLHYESHEHETGDAAPFLKRVLRERRAQALNRIFRHLALLYPPAGMVSAYHGVLSDNRQVRGSSEEYLSRTLRPAHREWILPLLPGAPDEARRELAKSRYGLEPLDPHESLARLLESPDQWLRAVAMYVVGLRREREFRPLVQAGLEARDERVRETAGWALHALGPAWGTAS